MSLGPWFAADVEAPVAPTLSEKPAKVAMIFRKKKRNRWVKVSTQEKASR